MTQQHRHYLYSILLAAVPILVAFGFIAGDQAQLWLTLGAAILAVPGLNEARRWSGADVEVRKGRHAAESSVDPD